jgi:hypothetical protein
MGASSDMGVKRRRIHDVQTHSKKNARWMTATILSPSTIEGAHFKIDDTNFQDCVKLVLLFLFSDSTATAPIICRDADQREFEVGLAQATTTTPVVIPPPPPQLRRLMMQ